MTLDTSINDPCGIVSSEEPVFKAVEDFSVVLLQPDKMTLATIRDSKVGLKFMLNLKIRK
jgi:hypothetical protein